MAEGERFGCVHWVIGGIILIAAGAAAIIGGLFDAMF